MRAVILVIAGLFWATPAIAGSLVPENTGFSEKNETKDLLSSTFSEGAQADSLSFNAIGQAGNAEIFDLGGTSGAAFGGDFFQELGRNAGGISTPLEENTNQTE